MELELSNKKPKTLWQVLFLISGNWYEFQTFSEYWFEKFEIEQFYSNQNNLTIRGWLQIEISSMFIWWIFRSVDYFIGNSRKILEKFLYQYSSVAEVTSPDILKNWTSLDLFLNFCKHLDKSVHIVSKNIMVHKGLPIFVF